jgi:D-glycero-D-manno-heptose 1,7-bisphosphate phosphatase
MGTNQFIGSSRALFLDRDGVVIRNIYKHKELVSPKKISDVHIYLEIEKIIRVLNENKIHTIIVTNQPDISRKKITWGELNNIHNYLIDRINLSAIIFCPHGTDDECICRKPKSGMLEKASAQFDLELEKCLLMGDRISDIMCAKEVNMSSIHITSDYDCSCLAEEHTDVESKKISKIVTNFFEIVNISN